MSKISLILTFFFDTAYDSAIVLQFTAQLLKSLDSVCYCVCQTHLFLLMLSGPDSP